MKLHFIRPSSTSTSTSKKVSNLSYSESHDKVELKYYKLIIILEDRNAVLITGLLPQRLNQGNVLAAGQPQLSI